MDLHRLTWALGNCAWQEADCLLATLTSAPDAQPSLLYNHGKVLIELGRMDEARAMLERAVGRAPNHGDAWFELGRAALVDEAFEASFEAFSKALKLAPSDRDARRNLGRVALRLGRYAQARAAWEPLTGDPEADLALYRVAAETRDPRAAELRQHLLARHPNRAAVIRTLARVSKGAIPLHL